MTLKKSSLQPSSGFQWWRPGGVLEWVLEEQQWWWCWPPFSHRWCVYDRTIEHSRFMYTSMWSSPLEPLHLPKSTLYVFGSNLLILLMWIWICRKRRISSYIWLTCLFSNIDYDKFFKPNSGLHFGSGSYQCVCRNRLLIIQNYAQVAKIIAFDDCVSIELGKKKEKRERDHVGLLVLNLELWFCLLSLTMLCGQQSNITWIHLCR